MNVREIAKLANVSIATVSRVINRPEVVLPETREQVLAVMRKVGYSPAPHAGGGAQPKGGRAFGARRGGLPGHPPDGGH